MSKKGLLIVGSVLVIGGVAGYFLWQLKKDKDKESEAKAKADAEAKAKAESGGTTDGSTGGGTGGGGSANTDRPSDILAFQKFANSKGWKPALVEDGKWGSKTNNAWATWKAEYNKTSSPVGTASTWEQQWNLAKSVGASYFQFGGKTYVTSTGRAYVDPSVIRVGDNVYAKSKFSTYADQNLSLAYWSGASSLGNFFKDQLVGKVVQVAGNSIKVENTYKPAVTSDGSYDNQFWVSLKGITKDKPTYVQP